MYMEHEPCNTSLALGLGTVANASAAASLRRAHDPKPFYILFPSSGDNGEGREEEQGVGRRRTRSAAEEQDAAEKDAHQDAAAAAKKKLRLTKEQSALLESSFRGRSTLTPNRKQELADRLNLRPRQVEVWFQNRRARTKLKQTEVDCEFLKKCCESLSDENRRLKEELHDLRSSSFSVHLPEAPTVAVCPSCERVAAAAAGGKMAPGAAACDVDVAVGRPRRLYSCAARDSSMAAR